jgi:hypothetical protein
MILHGSQAYVGLTIPNDAVPKDREFEIGLSFGINLPIRRQDF